MATMAAMAVMAAMAAMAAMALGQSNLKRHLFLSCLNGRTTEKYRSTENTNVNFESVFPLWKIIYIENVVFDLEVVATCE